MTLATHPASNSSPAQIDAAVHAAQCAAAAFGASAAAARSALLRGLADALEAERATLVPLADQESHLGAARLNGELDRTCFQLRGFAEQVDAGAPFTLTDDPALAGGPPAGRPRLTRVRVPLGPVAMFAASNFPFAFSVLGGDTASALAAGCPVVVKAHPGHPGLSRATAALAQRVVAAQGLPAGVFGMVEGAAVEVGVGLVRHPGVAAVAFTGSLRGGAALQQEVQQRPHPIPFYGELGSIRWWRCRPRCRPTGRRWPQGWQRPSPRVADSSAPARA
jgi:acyl-CoA reductase-like NAD-dependent aldehyde dehydrogenase